MKKEIRDFSAKFRCSFMKKKSFWFWSASPRNMSFRSSLSPFNVQSDVEASDRPTIALLQSIPKEYFCFCIPMSWIILPPEGEEVKIKNSDLSTMFLILNTMIGSGILVQAYVFQQSGIVAAIFEYSIICTMIYLGAELIIQCGDIIQVHDYSGCVGTILGPWGSFVVDISIVFNGAGALLSYVIIIGSLFSSIVQSGSCSNSSWYCNEGFLTILPILLFTVPLCLIRRFGHLAYISYASIFVIGSVVLLVLIGGPIRKQYYVDDDSSVNTGNFIGCMATVGDIVFALGYITAIFHTFHAHENKNISQYQALTLKTTVIGALMCFFTGLVGYLSFLGGTQTNILENFPGAVGDLFKMAVIVHLLLYIPGDFVILRAALWKLFKTDVAKQSDSQFIAVTLACIFVITGVGIALLLSIGDNSSLGNVVNITGGISGSVLYFILPGISTLKVIKPEDVVSYRKAVGLVIFGVIIFVMVFVGTFI